jgi:lysyl-tRNA synthetase class 2
MTETLWRPSACIENLKQRAGLMRQIRSFFETRDYLEVETPAMAHFGVTDPYLSNIKAVFRNQIFCLQTSPEYHMKRLLAAGSGPIFQLAQVFRDDELGRWHNPEFTLLEWYKLSATHHELMDEVDLFLQFILNTMPMKRMTYHAAFLASCELNPFEASIDDLKSVVRAHQLEGVLPSDEQDVDQYLFLLMSHVVEPFLSKEETPVAVYHFPPTQAALSKVSEGVAQRFEVYFKGVELANGFHELIDASAQANRFSEDNACRKQRGLPLIESDYWLIDALKYGIPPCSGVALGVDRLLALAMGKQSIAEVMAFDVERA